MHPVHCLPTSVAVLTLMTFPAPAAVQAQEPQEPPPSATVATPASPAAPPAGLPSPESLGLIPGRPRVTPTRTDTPPRIDGVLDDPMWERAAHLTGFTQQAPNDGAPATERTDVYIAYDDDHLYFAFYAHYEDPSIMRANRVDRDRAASDDLITVYLDTYLNQQRGYDFDVNGYGVQGDGIITAGGPGGAIPRADRSWDALFETAGQIVEDGFVVEMAIPFKSLRYPSRAPGEPHRWGLQIIREVKAKSEENQVWAPMSRDESSFFAQMGILEGMTDISTSRNFEILPTVTSIQYGAIDPTVPGFVNQSANFDAGLNVKYGITSDLTADFTLNPDFSQIESDRTQIEVNQRFPVFYQELRPFFVEGAEIFDIRAPVTLVHTRTIVDPDYGAKLSGKVGNLSVGLLTANDRAPGRIEDLTDPMRGEKAQTFIARARYDLWAETNVGAIVTDREFMDGYSRLGGVDGNFRLTSTMAWDFRAVGSLNRDGAAEDEVSGHMFATRLQRSGRNLGFSVQAHQTSPDFDTKVGFIRRRDQRTLSGNTNFTWYPGNRIVNWGPQFSYSRVWDYDGVLVDESFGTSLNVTLQRNIGFGVSVDRDMERFGGIEFQKTGFSVNARVNTSNRYNFGGNFSIGDQVRYTSSPFLGHGRRWGLNGTLRPLPSLQTSLNLSASRLTNPQEGGATVFDVKVVRSNTTYQITDRMGVRSIVEYNTGSETVAFNVLMNYRVNAGTVLYLGYDDHYQQEDLIRGDRNGDGMREQLFYADGMRRTNRAIFVKFQYLLRY
jgi:hypothetical protein